MRIQHPQIYLGNAFSTLFAFLLIFPTLISTPLSTLSLEALDEHAKLSWLLLPIMALITVALGRSMTASMNCLFDRPSSSNPSRLADILMYGLAFRPKRPKHIARNPAERAPSIWLLIASAILAGFVGTQAIDTLVQLAIGRDIIAPYNITTLAAFVQAAIPLALISPLIETVIMAATVECARTVFQWKPSLIMGLSAFGWALLHAINNHPLQAFSMCWLFLIFTTLYLRVRAVAGWVPTAVALLFVHAINNGLALGVIAIKQSVLGL